MDPASAQAHSSLAAAKFFFDWDWQGSLGLSNTALEAAARLLGWQPFTFMEPASFFLGRFEEARTCLETAVHLDPLSFRMNRTLGTLCYLQGRSDEAETWLEAAVALKPDSAESHYLLARLHLQQGNRIRRFAMNEALKCQEGSVERARFGYFGSSADAQWRRQLEPCLVCRTSGRNVLRWVRGSAGERVRSRGSR